MPGVIGPLLFCLFLVLCFAIDDGRLGYGVIGLFILSFCFVCLCWTLACLAPPGLIPLSFIRSCFLHVSFMLQCSHVHDAVTCDNEKAEGVRDYLSILVFAYN